MSQGRLKSAAPEGAIPQTGSGIGTTDAVPARTANAGHPADPASTLVAVVEIGGRDGPEPTRYGDWEKAGRCIDF